MSKLTADQEKIVRLAVREKTVENRISCHQARKIAADLKLPIRQVGEVIDAMKVRISQCELGCF